MLYLKRMESIRYMFNPIGQFWNVPIESANVSISFENNVPVGENEVQQLEVYTGEYGETGKNYTIVQESGIIKIKTNEILEPRNGLSFRLNLKTDKISPTWLDKLEVLYYADPLIIAWSCNNFNAGYIWICNMVPVWKRSGRKSGYS